MQVSLNLTNYYGENPMNMSESFIPGALNRLCQGKTNSYGANLANYIAGFTNADTPIDVAYAAAAIECNGDRDSAPFPTFAILGHMQTLMDRIMWNARGLKIAYDRAAKQEEESGGIYGVELAQSKMDEVGVTDIPLDRIRDAVESDYELLFTTQVNIMASLGIDGEAFDIDLLFFNPSSLDETTETWVKLSPAETYDEAMLAMDKIVDELNAKANKTAMAEFMKNREELLKSRLAA